MQVVNHAQASPARVHTLHCGCCLVLDSMVCPVLQAYCCDWLCCFAMCFAAQEYLLHELFLNLPCAANLGTHLMVVILWVTLTTLTTRALLFTSFFSSSLVNVYGPRWFTCDRRQHTHVATAAQLGLLSPDSLRSMSCKKLLTGGLDKQQPETLMQHMRTVLRAAGLVVNYLPGLACQHFEA